MNRDSIERLADWLGPSAANPGLAYVDTNSNGFGIASFNGERCAVELVTTAPPLSPSDDAGSEVMHRAQFELPRWAPGESPQLQGPTFEGKPPFPYGD